MIFPWKKITKIPWPRGGFPSHALTTGRAWSRSLLIELRGCLLALRQQGLADEDFPHGKNHGENHRFHWFQQENLGIFTARIHCWWWSFWSKSEGQIYGLCADLKSRKEPSELKKPLIYWFHQWTKMVESVVDWWFGSRWFGISGF